MVNSHVVTHTFRVKVFRLVGGVAGKIRPQELRILSASAYGVPQPGPSGSETPPG